MKLDYLYLIIAGVFAGFIVFGGKVFSNLGLSLYEISVFPFMIALILLLPFVIFKKEYRLKKNLMWIWAIYGFVAAITVLAEVGSVILGVPVAIAVLLLYTQPLWTIIFSSYFMKEKITKREIFAGFFVLLGIVILVNPFRIDSAGGIIGVIVALIGGLSLSGWVIFGSYASKKKAHPVPTLFAESFFGIVSLALFYPLISLITNEKSLVSFSFNLPLNMWIYLILFALLTKLIVHLSYLKGIKRVPTSHGGIIMLLEPVSGAILAVLFLSQAITLNMLIGGLLILFANYLVITKK